MAPVCRRHGFDFENWREKEEWEKQIGSQSVSSSPDQCAGKVVKQPGRKKKAKKDTNMYVPTAIQTVHVSIVLSHIKKIGFGKESQNSETGWVSAERWQLSSGEPKTEGNWQRADWDGGMRKWRHRGQWEEQTTLGRVAMEARGGGEVAF